MQILQEKKYFYILEYDELTGEYFGNTLRNGWGFYCQIKLTAEEIADYEANNESSEFWRKKLFIHLHCRAVFNFSFAESFITINLWEQTTKTVRTL